MTDFAEYLEWAETRRRECPHRGSIRPTRSPARRDDRYGEWTFTEYCLCCQKSREVRVIGNSRMESRWVENIAMEDPWA